MLKRAGHTEAAVDLARLAGLQPAGVLAEVVNDDGTMQRLPQLEQFAKEHGLQLISIADLIRYRRHREKLVTRVSEARIPTKYGDFTAYVYRSQLDDVEHIAFVCGEVSGADNVLVRVHSECLTGDVFGSMRCDCGMQLDLALERIADEGRGVLVYLRGHEGRGIGLGHKMRAYNLQDQGRDTVRGQRGAGLRRRLPRVRHRLADPRRPRDHDDAPDDQQSGEVRRASRATVSRSSTGCRCARRPPHENIAYLRTKQEKLGHLLDLEVGLDQHI